MNSSHLPLGSLPAALGFDWIPADSAIEWVYLGTAVIGGGVLLIQIVLSMFGADHDADGDISHDAGESHDGGVGSWLSFRAIVAFLTFFGIGGMVASTRGSSGVVSLAAAFASGSVAFLLTRVALLQMDKLRASGTVDIRNAIGTEGRVYLPIPAAKSGQGAVTIGIQGRTMQYRAITPGPELKTGELCKVSAVHAADTLVVDAL